MEQNKSILLDSNIDSFIKSRVSSGSYKNANEVIRAGLKLPEDEENRVIALRNAINEGIDSGTAHDFNNVKHLRDLKSNRQLKNDKILNPYI